MSAENDIYLQIVKSGEELARGGTETPGGRAKKLFLALVGNPFLHVFLLIALVFACYGRTLTSFFLADDFSEVRYVSQIFNGQPGLFFSNWTGNYMQIPGMNVYRPWLLMTLVFDWLIFKTNAWGYYLSNLTYFAGACALLYLAARELTKSWRSGLSKAASWFAAAFFAASPLRCESVSWVVGRVDIVCAFYYFAAFWCFLKSRQSKRKIFIALGVSSFGLAILTKEMAIGLPVVLAALELIGLNDKVDNRNAATRFKQALAFSLPLWVAAALYFVIRLLCLHTLVGGYVAGFGASQMSMMTQRWLDPDTARRLLLPFSYDLFPTANIYTHFLAGAYSVAAALVALRLTQGQFAWKWFAFLAVWLLTAAAPIYQLWGLGYNLEGARFYLFMAAPMSMFLPVMLLKPVFARDLVLDVRVKVISLAVLSVALLVLARLAYLSDLVWVHAGKEVRAIYRAASALALKEGNEKYCLLGIPEARGGAHLILNGSTFETMLSPPFAPDLLSRRFITFAPVMFSPSQLINGTRFRNAISSQSQAGPLVWSRSRGNFVNNPLAPRVRRSPARFPEPGPWRGWQPHSFARGKCDTINGVIRLTDTVEGDGVRISKLHLNPLDFDFLEFQIRGRPEGVNPQLKVFFHGKRAVDYDAKEFVAVKDWVGSEPFMTVRVRLSHFWRWYAQGEIDELILVVPPEKEIELKDFKLVSADDLAPEMILRGSPVDNQGIQTPPARWVNAAIDMRSVPNPAGVYVEIGKDNFFFDNFEGIQAISPVAATLDLTHGARLDPKYFAQPGFYQLRVRCFDEGKNPIGEYSDPVTVKIR